MYHQSPLPSRGRAREGVETPELEWAGGVKINLV